MSGLPNASWNGSHLWGASPDAKPTEDDVNTLIQKAQGHELGLEYLQKGAHDSVAATFGVHAFLVDAARDHLRQQPPR